MQFTFNCKMPFDTQNVNVPTDFTVGEVNVKFGGDEAEASTVFKQSFDFVVDDSAEAGKIIQLVDLDVDITETTTQLAGEYEEYSFSNLKFAVQSHSPMGAASGGVQVAHHPDPLNGNYGTNLLANIQKAVRQSGSVLVRPRDTKDLIIDTHETLYTKEGASKRFSSFGVVAFIVRAKPATGDEIRFTVTMEGTLNLFRPTIRIGNSVYTDQVVLRQKHNTGKKLFLSTPDILLQGEITAQLHDPLVLSYDAVTKFGGINTKVVKLDKVKLEKTDSVHMLMFRATDKVPAGSRNLKIICPTILKAKLRVVI